LLDSELLAEVYIELIGGKQAALTLDNVAVAAASAVLVEQTDVVIAPRPAPLPSRLSEAERSAHAALVETLGEKAVWLSVTGQ
jgi:DNA polymerase-3 subunit epsilon